MKKTFAAVVFLAALGVFCKLALKHSVVESPDEIPSGPTAAPLAPNDEALLAAKYPAGKERDLVARSLKKYSRTAVAIESTHGLRGLKLLDRLDLEAIYLYEKHPDDFRRLSASLTDDAAADLVLHWSEYFGLKHSDDTDRSILVTEIARLSKEQRKWASKYPNALPLILADPPGVTTLIERLDDDPEALGDALVMLDLVSLERGVADLASALRTLDARPALALDAFRKMGPEGFALVMLYGEVLDALNADVMPLESALIALRVNTDYVDGLLAAGRPEVVARHLAHAASVGLTEAIGGHPQALRLAVEYGESGEKALRNAGSDAADVVYTNYADPTLRNQAVAALAEHGMMALVILDKYAPDQDFREILRHYGPAVVPPVAKADASPELLASLRNKSRKTFTESMAEGILAISSESGQDTIRRIKSDGLERMAELTDGEVKFYQFLPMYDMVHLGGVVGRGQSPTSGEMAWALLDGCFVVADVLSLTAMQPEGAVAVEVVRSEIKAASREGVKTVGKGAIEEAAQSATKAMVRQGSEAATEKASRWWAVRTAGGTYRLLKRLPEAMAVLPLPRITAMSRAFCAKAGLHLSEFGPRRFLLKTGLEKLIAIPPEKGMKYLGKQAITAGVGVVAIHKMEEHLASRRPQNP